MKKSLFMIMAAGLMTFAACGNKSTQNAESVEEKAEPTGTKLELATKTYEGDSLMVSCDLWYPKDAGVQEIEVFGTFYARKTLADSAANAKMEIYLQESSAYKDHKEVAAKDHPDTYKEFKIGEYDAYAYESVRSYYVTILFEHISETTDRFMDIVVSQINSTSDLPTGKDFFEQNDNGKAIVNSIRYNGVVARTIDFN